MILCIYQGISFPVIDGLTTFDTWDAHPTCEVQTAWPPFTIAKLFLLAIVQQAICGLWYTYILYIHISNKFIGFFVNQKTRLS